MRSRAQIISNDIVARKSATFRAIRSLFRRNCRVKVTFSPNFIEPTNAASCRHPRYIALPRLTPTMARKQALLYFFDVLSPTSLRGFSPLLGQLNTMPHNIKPFCYMIGYYPPQADIEHLRNGTTIDDARFLCKAVGAELYHVQSFCNETWAHDLMEHVLRKAFVPTNMTPARKNGVIKSILNCLCMRLSEKS